MMNEKIKISAARRWFKRFFLTLSKPSRKRGYNKVFCVGYLKTGTTSFGEAMIKLGFKHAKYDKTVFEWYQQGQIEKVFKYAEYFESFDDLPWNKLDIIYQLDKHFPNSKFVLLEREPEAWVRSFQKHGAKFNRINAPDKEKAIAGLKKRNEAIKDYFRDQEEKLLVMNVTAGDGYEKLCPFLNLPILNESFPHSNKSSN